MLKHISLILASLASSTLAQTPNVELPEDGRFFYMVSPQGNNAPGINAFEVTVGTQDGTSERQVITNVAISASE